MGKDLHYTILTFFRARMNEHSMVEDFYAIEDENNYLFVIERARNFPDVVVHLSDSYIYTLHEYHSRPSILGQGDYILVARPEAKYTGDALMFANNNKMGLGKLSEFMSALTRRNVWTHKPKRKRES